MTMRRRTAASSVVAGVVLLVVAAAATYTAVVDRRAAATPVVAVAPEVDPQTAAIEAAQQRLAEVPGDWTTWAQLGALYVEQARVTADPSFYDRAEGALRSRWTCGPTATTPR